MFKEMFIESIESYPLIKNNEFGYTGDLVKKINKRFGKNTIEDWDIIDVGSYEMLKLTYSNSGKKNIEEVKNYLLKNGIINNSIKESFTMTPEEVEKELKKIFPYVSIQGADGGNTKVKYSTSDRSLSDKNSSQFYFEKGVMTSKFKNLKDFRSSIEDEKDALSNKYRSR